MNLKFRSNLRFKLATLFKTLVDLQMMVQGIEEDLGLSDLGNIDKKVLLSIIEFYDQNGVASTAEILAHPLLNTFHAFFWCSCCSYPEWFVALLS